MYIYFHRNGIIQHKHFLNLLFTQLIMDTFLKIHLYSTYYLQDLIWRTVVLFVALLIVSKTTNSWSVFNLS